MLFVWVWLGFCGVLWALAGSFERLGPKQAPEIPTPPKNTWYFFIYLVIFGLPRKKAVAEVQGIYI